MAPAELSGCGCVAASIVCHCLCHPVVSIYFLKSHELQQFRAFLQVSTEGEHFTVPVEVAKMSVLCRDMMDSTCSFFWGMG